MRFRQVIQRMPPGLLTETLYRLNQQVKLTFRSSQATITDDVFQNIVFVKQGSSSLAYTWPEAVHITDSIHQDILQHVQQHLLAWHIPLALCEFCDYDSEPVNLHPLDEQAVFDFLKEVRVC